MIATKEEDDRIDNYEQVIETLEGYGFLQPDGSREEVRVDNPRLTPDAPKFLRVSVPRKGFTFHVIEDAQSFGLEVTDLWQMDKDKEADRIKFKLEPSED